MGSRLVLGLQYCLGLQAHQGHQVGPIGGCGMEVEGVECVYGEKAKEFIYDTGGNYSVDCNYCPQKDILSDD